MEKTQPPKAILKTSIEAMLAPERPTLASVIRRIGMLGLFSVICAASVGTAQAQSSTPAPTSSNWIGPAGTPAPNNNWSNSANWTGGAVPIQGSTTGSNLTFSNSSVGGTTNNDLTNSSSSQGSSQSSSSSTPLVVNTITFSAGAPAYTVTGLGISLTNGITNASSNTQTFNLTGASLVLNGSQTWSASNSAGTIVVTGAASTNFVNLNGSTLTVTGPGTVDFETPLQDSSARAASDGLIVSGPGTVFLNAMTNTYTGPTSVNGGVLVVNGSIATSTLTTVAQGGILTGNGTTGNLTNNGIVAPLYVAPNSNLPLSTAISSNVASINGVPQFPANQLVLTVKGTYTQGASGTLVIAYGGPAATQHTSLAVQGQANLGGTLRLVDVNGAKLTANQIVPIITASGGVVGKFATVQNAGLIGASVIYTKPNEVVLETSQVPINNVLGGLSGISSNLTGIGAALDAAANDPRAAKIFAVLDADSPSQLARDIQRISPDQLTSTNNVGASTSSAHLSNVTLRMSELQSGVTGFSALGFHVTDNTNSQDNTDGYAGPSGPDGKGSKEVAPPPPNNRWGAFITGSGEFDHVGDTSTARGFNLDSGGITLGVDYRFTDHFVAGIFSGYTYAGYDIANGGRIAEDSGKIGLYATYFDGGFYANTAVQGGYNTYETNRAGLDGTAHSSPVGGDFDVLFATGYNWTLGGLTIGPTAKFQYSYQGTNGFTETGSLAPLDVSSMHTTSLVSGFGMKASYDWKIGTVIIRPELRLEWEHEYGDVVSTVGAQLASGAGDSFTVLGPQIGRDSLHLGSGVAVVFNEWLTAYAYYDGEFFRTNYDSSVVTGGFRLSF